jgi:DNA-directed RNA polymerase subunit RPC12/RpoP
MSEPFYDASVGLRFAGMCGQQPEKIRWYINPLFEPEEGDKLCTVEHTLLPLKKATKSSVATKSSDVMATKSPVATKSPDVMATNDAIVTTNDAKVTTNVGKKVYRKRPIRCPECDALFDNRHALHNHRRRGKCPKRTDDVTTNDATVTTNDATVTTNDATVTTNDATVTTNDATVTTNDATVTTNDAIVTTNVGKKVYRKRPIRCPECDALFDNRHALHNHRRRGKCPQKTDETNN